MFKNKTIFITGGTGSWGQKLVKYLLNQDSKEIRIFSRNESLQVKMQRTFKNEKIKFIIGDVKDKNKLIKVTKNVDYLVHLAALKHVPICEQELEETFLTNVIGTKNVIEAALKNKILKVLYISSDKAVNPCNFYGLTKAMGEKLIIKANQEQTETKFICFRAGNVIGTSGSVIPLFINQLKNKENITITDQEMTRFFITLDEAIKTLLKVLELGRGGEIIITKMPSFKIMDLAQILIKHYGNENTIINFSEIRPGEKIHEELISEVESKNCFYLKDNYYLIISPIMKKDLTTHYKNLKRVNFTSYKSSQNLLTKLEIEEKLKESKYL